jgi:hypothetical protein
VVYKNCYEKVIIICNTHGNILQSPSSHLQGYGCKQCGYTKPQRTTEEFIEKSKKIFGDNRFDYSATSYKNSLTKVAIICPIKNHGIFFQNPGDHLSAKNGCIICAYPKKYTTDEYITECKKKYGELYNYTKINYCNSNKKITIICPMHGKFKKFPMNFLTDKTGCSKCALCPSCQLWFTKGALCKYCVPMPQNKLYQKTKEMAIVKFLKDNLPNNDFIHNKSAGSDCTGTHLFPDIRFDCNFYHLIIEVDEHKHRGAGYECDKKRMHDIIAKLGLPCIFIRYNPDNKNSDKNVLLNKISQYLELEEDRILWDDHGFMAEYLYY